MRKYFVTNFNPDGNLQGEEHPMLSPLQVNYKLKIIVIFPLRGLLLCLSMCRLDFSYKDVLYAKLF